MDIAQVSNQIDQQEQKEQENEQQAEKQGEQKFALWPSNVPLPLDVDLKPFEPLKQTMKEMRDCYKEMRLVFSNKPEADISGEYEFKNGTRAGDFAISRLIKESEGHKKVNDPEIKVPFTGLASSRLTLDMTEEEKQRQSAQDRIQALKRPQVSCVANCNVTQIRAFKYIIKHGYGLTRHTRLPNGMTAGDFATRYIFNYNLRRVRHVRTRDQKAKQGRLERAKEQLEKEEQNEKEKDKETEKEKEKEKEKEMENKKYKRRRT